jgi:hypothetical protein
MTSPIYDRLMSEVDEEGWRDKEPDFYYCAHHAKHAGFCICCGEFWAGIESFDFEHRCRNKIHLPK